MIKISGVTATNGSAVIQISSSESLTSIIAGDLITLQGFLPETVLSVDTNSRTITLTGNWDEVTTSNVKAVVQETVSNLNNATQSINDLVSRSNQYISQWDAMTNESTTVTITGPGNESIELDSIPLIVSNATVAGTTLYNEVQASITLLGDLPAQAQAVQDSVDIFTPQYDEWVLNSPEFLNNYSTVNSNITTFNTTTYPSSTSAFSALVNDSTTTFNTLVSSSTTSINTLVSTASGHVDDAEAQAVTATAQVVLAAAEVTNAQGKVDLADAAAVLADNFANYPEDSEIPNHSGKYSSYHWNQKAVALAGGTAPDSLKLGGETAVVWDTKIVDLETYVDTSIGELEVKINIARLLALAGI